MAEHALDGVTATPKAQLPEALAAELNRWAEQFAHDAGAGTRDALAQAEDNLEGLRTQLESVTQARDEALADAAEQAHPVTTPDEPADVVEVAPGQESVEKPSSKP